MKSQNPVVEQEKEVKNEEVADIQILDQFSSIPSQDDSNDSNVSSALTISASQDLFPQKDEMSLQHLAQIKENQVIDVYVDSTVSEPYDDVENGYLWGTGLWLLGYGTNSDDDLIKIKNLMSRALYAYKEGYKPVKGKLEEALIGLEKLNEHYISKGRTSTSGIITNIIEYVEACLTLTQEEYNQNSGVHNENKS